MALIVQKFGGTSVGSPERIRAVADRIALERAQGNELVVVVSAMGHTTDELIELAHQVSDNPPHREMDMLLTAGERVSMALLSMALADRDVPAVSLTGSQSGIITDGSHRRARIKRILGDRVRAGVADGKVVIVAGFQGVSETKEITTLGRGGSDTTAVALAAVLQAERCDIFTDVNGIYSADPRVVPEARFWSVIPHDHMVELATRGAGVLHPRSVELAKQFGVALRVRNSMNQTEGTSVESGKAGMEEFDITGVTADKGRMLLTIHLARPTVLGAVWDMAAEQHLSIMGPVFHDSRVDLFVERDADAEWKKNLEYLCTEGFVKSYELQPGLAPVSIVGNRFSQDGAAFSQVIETLARSQIPVTMGASSSLAIGVAVSLDHVDDAVRALHSEFIREN